MTSKGQFTLPVAVRRELGLKKAGDTLTLDFDKSSQKATIYKPVTIEELSERISSYIKPGTEPVLNVDEYYQKHRGKQIR
jgi:bifunctional DNA-binding transcriptional regulator/antitoxin component of YhaV-PrlF toxin-antitoxin module